MRAVIGLLSCQQEFARLRRNLCRETWLPAVKTLGYDVFFLLGGGQETGSDFLKFAVGDTYPELPQKTRAFCRWALDHGYDRLFKADDDTFIHPTRFHAWMTEMADEHYVGSEWRDGVNYGSGGAGYLLSATAAKIVADGMGKRCGAEDLTVGTLLRRANIRLRIDRRLIPFGNEERRPKPDNDIITTHKIPEHLWRSCWMQLNQMST
jgi:hypothetical protein